MNRIETEEQMLEATNQAAMMMLERMGAGEQSDSFMYTGFISLWTFTPEELLIVRNALRNSSDSIAAPLWLQMNEAIQGITTPEV